MTATDSRPYVVCDQFCGRRLFEPGPLAHDEQCAAPAEEIARLDALLAEARINGAAAADAADAEPAEPEPEPTPIPPTATPGFVCSCRASFWTYEQLAAHQTENEHDGCAVDDEDDGDGERVAETTVDGQRARVHHHAPNADPAEGEKKKNLAHLWRDPIVHASWVYALQIKIDESTIDVAGVAAGKACIGKITAIDDDGSRVEVDCPHRTVMRSIRKNTCSLEHQHTETLAQVCLIHAVCSWGGEIPVADAGPLFAGMA